MNKKLKKKISYMANGGSIKYSLDANGNLVQDPNGTMDQNGITIPNFQPNSNPNIQQDYDNAQLGNTNQGSMGNSASSIGGYIQQGAKALGSVLDTVGSISRGIITAAPGIINTLLGPEDTKQRKFQIDSANNNPLGNGTQAFRDGGTFIDNYSKGAEYIRPIEIAKSGAIVTNYGIGENIPNLTDIQSQALNTFIPYQPSIHDEVGISTRSNNSATEPFMKSYGSAVTGANAYQGANYSGQMWGNPTNIGPAVQGQSDPYGSSYIPMDNGQFRINTDLAPTRFSYNTNTPYQMGDGGKVDKNKPIEVTDPNDPRYKAYLDSTAAHQKSMDIVKSYRDLYKGGNQQVMVGPPAAFGKPIRSIEEAARMFDKRKSAGESDDNNYIEPPFSNKGLYKNWPAPKYLGIKFQGQLTGDGTRINPLTQYYDAPTQQYILKGNTPKSQVPQPTYTPPRSKDNLNPLDPVTQGNLQNNITPAIPIQWDTTYNTGIFPIYGQNNQLQGSWDRNKDGNIDYYPTQGQDNSIPNGLPSNTIVNPYPSTSITNIRSMKDGGTIKINPKNKGKFNELKERTGKSTEELTHSKNPLTRKRAIFAQNASKWNHAELGAEINSQSVLNTPNNNQGYNISDFKVDPLQANVVAEGGEFAQLPDGSTGNITGDKHSDSSGGEYLNLPDQTRIYSDKLKVDKDFASTVLNTKVKRKFSIADLAKKFNTDKDDKVIADKNSTDLAKRTASINKEIKTNKLDEIFNYQEGLKNPVIDNNNLPIAADGIEIRDNNKIVPEGYTPYVDQGYMYNGDYVNAQPYNANYRNPRYMFLNPIVADAAQSSDNTPLQPLDNSLSPLPVNTNTSPIQPIDVPQTSYTQPSANTSPSTAQNALEAAKKFSNGLGSGIRDFIPELFGLSQALSPFPIHTSKFQPVYMTPTEINVQDNLNRNYASAKGLLDTPGNNSVSNARAQQTAANLYDANNQVYQQKYNIDNQNRQQVTQYNNQLENNANQTNLQRVDQFWDKMTARKANQERDLQNIVNSAYSKSKSQQLESRQLDLVNQMFPNYKYNVNQGEQFVPVTGPDGQIFHVPVSSLQSPNSTVQQGDGVKTTIKRKFNPKTGKYDTTQTDSERSGY